MARLVVEALPKAVPELTQYLRVHQSVKPAVRVASRPWPAEKARQRHKQQPRLCGLIITFHRYSGAKQLEDHVQVEKPELGMFADGEETTG